MYLNRVKVQLCKLFSRNFLIAGCEVRHLCKHVNKDTDAIVTLGGDWQLSDEIKVNRIERMLRQFQRLKKPIRSMTTGLMSLAGITFRNMVLRVCLQRRPPKEFIDCLICLVLSKVSAYGVS
jgi:hypothetical protein